MLFRRRKPAGMWEKARVVLWPRRSFSRSFLYFGKRILRLSATPHAIAAGVAAGVMASWTPFIGLHFIIAAVIAFVVAGNVIASALGTAFGNPLTFPFIWTASYKLGQLILVDDYKDTVTGVDLVRMVRDLNIHQLWEPVLKPMLVGCLPFAAGFGLGFYILTYVSVATFQSRRRRHLSARRLEQGGSGRQTV